jgi:hypothetical protein
MDAVQIIDGERHDRTDRMESAPSTSNRSNPSNLTGIPERFPSSYALGADSMYG